MAKAPTARSLAEKLCREFPDTPNRTLAHKLYKDNVERFPNLDSARSAIRVVRGAIGKGKRQFASVEKPHGKAGWVASCPPSSAEPWLPVQIDGPCRVLSLSDAHIPFHELRALEAAVKWGRKFKPDVVLLNGDWADFYNVSKWERDPKMRDFRGEIDTVKESLSWLRGQFKNARIIYKMGNHEERYDKFIWNKCIELWNLKEIQIHNILELEKLGIERVDDNAVMAGALPILHGHELLRGAFSPVNQARGAFLRTNHSNLTGHGHRTSTHCEPDMFGKEITCWSQGSLCDPHPKYARFPKWNWGFAGIEVADDNEYDMHNLRISADYKVRAA